MRLSVIALAMIGALQTPYPGQMTQARVWVQNQHNEAIPVDLRDVNLDKPIRVHVMNDETGSDVVPVRLSRQQWEYETAVVPARDMAGVLIGRGLLGWEAVGVTTVTAESVTVLLKRPR